MKKGMVLHGKHYFKGHRCYFGWISMLLSDFDPIQHYCMGLISENKGYSPRQGLIVACIPPVQKKKGQPGDVSVLRYAFCRAESFPFIPSSFFFLLYSIWKNILLHINQRGFSWFGAFIFLHPDVPFIMIKTNIFLYSPARCYEQ